VQLLDVATASAEVGATSARLAKIARIAELLSRAGTKADPRLVAVVVSWLSGELPQRQIGVGWASLRSLPPPAVEPSLTVLGVDAAFTEIGRVSGKGSQARRAELVSGLFAAATEDEQTFLRRLLGGELRQGALVGVMADAVAKAAEIPAAAVRRAAMLGGALPAVAAAALTGGEAALEQFTLQVGRPVGPMLAQTATGVAEALERLSGTAVFEAKLDGARVQIHRAGDAVSIYTRSLDDVTERLPEVVEAALSLPVSNLIADAEAIALRPDGRPHRFQVTASRFGRSVDIAAARASQPLSVFVFERARRSPRRPRAQGASGGSADHRRHRLRPAVSRRDAGSRTRRGDGEIADRAVRSRPTRRRLAEGQARPYSRPGGARRRVGIGPAHRQAVQHPSRCT
jgi:DNA ligase-1